MSAKRAAKRNLFTLLGWLVWKIAALFGSRYARRKLEERHDGLAGGPGAPGRLRRALHSRKR